jgi:hypothetical protein
MTDSELTETDKKILSYCSRGASKQTAVEKMSEFFSMKTGDVMATLDKLRRLGLVIESRSVAGVTVYMTSPLKVKSAMIDQRVITALKELEQGGKAAGFKKHTFSTNVETGEIVSGEARHSQKKSGPDLGFDIE